MSATKIDQNITDKAKDRINDIRPQTLEKRVATRNSLLRLFFVILIVLFQAMLMLYLLTVLQQRYTWFATTARIISLALILMIYSQDKTPSLKMPWIVLILLVPIAGSLLYLMVGLSGTTYRMRARYQRVDDKLLPILKQDEEAIDALSASDRSVSNMAQYIRDRAGFPIYADSDIFFFPTAEEALAAQLEELRNAEKFIFMEYHAIEDKESFREIKDILAEKVQEGLDVRVFYDDMGSIGFISREFRGILTELGIQCRVFNPVTMFFNFFLNNRDHRKITVIDGKVGFTGGYNLADEYFNITHPYGHWKDTGVMIRGNAVANLTAMFLEMWNAVKDSDKDDTDLMQFFPGYEYEQREPRAFVQPYGDTPLDNEQVGENVYLNIVNAAEEYVWFTTPYLIITDEMNRALCLAAERGVDVRIITPGKPDKRTIYSVTRSYYQRLVQGGVRIYEYQPGFIHAKQCVSDGKVATCGTINLDYRSLYHHFEDGCLFYNCRAVSEVRDDFDDVLASCREVTEEYSQGVGLVRTIWYHVLRLFSALL